MVQRRDRPRLALEPLAEISLRDFQRNAALEARVPGLVDLTHSPSANESEDFVRAKITARQQRHE
jgi:hypothetical protein